jgi:hypothetical protein
MREIGPERKPIYLVQFKQAPSANPVPNRIGTSRQCHPPDRSWLVWHLPVEYPESGTVLLDLRNDEYRILDGGWEGVQWWP